MNKKDVIDIMIGCLSWVAVIVLVILTERGFLDFNTLFRVACYIIAILGLVLSALLFLWLSLKK